MPRVVAVILAAGAGRRLGGRKPLTLCAGETLLARAVRAGREAGLDGTLAVFGDVEAELVAAATEAALPFTVNAGWRDGMGSSIATAIAALPDDCDAVLLRTVDQVLVDADGLDALLDAWQRAPDAIAAAHYSGATGVPAIFPRRCFDALGALAGPSGARGIIAGDGNVIAVELEDAALDVDTPGDLARAEAALVSRARDARASRSARS